MAFPAGLQNIVMCGDGATDMETRCPGGSDTFIGYGGVTIRPAVEQKSDWYIKDFADLNKAFLMARQEKK